VKKLVANTGGIAIRLSQGSADAGKQNSFHNVSNEKLFTFLPPLASPENKTLSQRRRLIL
jgi:hypothetical protein